MRQVPIRELNQQTAGVTAYKTMTAFVTYDKRLAAAASEVGHTVVAPGTS